MLEAIAQAYKELADAQTSGDEVAIAEATARLGELIQTAEALPAMPDIPATDDENPSSIAEQRREVMDALHAAATSGNVPAALKWLDLTREIPDEPFAETQAEPDKKRRRGKKPKRPKKPREQKITLREGKFIEFYFGDSAYNGTDAARKAGYKGNDNVLAVTAHDILKRPKIRKLIEARIDQMAMPLEQVFRLLGEQARGSIEHFLDIPEDETPALSLKRAKQQGKLHLIKNITFYPESEGGGVKNLAWYSALEAAKAIGNLHRLVSPRKPTAEVGDTPEEAARSYETARDDARSVIDTLMRKFKLSESEAARRALPAFPAAKEWIREEPEPTATPAVN